MSTCLHALATSTRSSECPGFVTARASVQRNVSNSSQNHACSVSHRVSIEDDRYHRCVSHQHSVLLRRGCRYCLKNCCLTRLSVTQ